MNWKLKIACLCATVFVTFSGLALTGCGPREEEPADDIAREEREERIRPSREPITEERVYYGFEDSLNGWEIPGWARNKSDYSALSVELSGDYSTHGDRSMKVMCDFPGGEWRGALVEIQQYLNMSYYRQISADVYLPEDAPVGLTAVIILTVGENWKFVEMARNIPLIPGRWVTLSANFEPGSYDWRRVVPDEKFAEDVRKIAIRLVSNDPEYQGPIYIDNIRVGR